MSANQKKKFRKNVAISIDGGGIRGIIATKALSMLEKKLIDDGYIKKSLNEKVCLFVGTSTGAIIAAALAAGVTASELNILYKELGEEVFKKFGRWRRFIFKGEKYSNDKLEFYLKRILDEKIGKNAKMKSFYSKDPNIDVIFTTFDLNSNKIRFIKPWNKPDKKGDVDFTKWTVVKALLASTAAPTYFPAIKDKHGDDQYIDGGVSSYNNPCFIAAYEILNHLKAKGWTMKNTTLISIGTGRGTAILGRPGKNKLSFFRLPSVLLDAFMISANDQQVTVVEELLKDLDFRRFQVNLKENIALDYTSKIDELEMYGEELGKKIVENVKESLDEREWRDPGSVKEPLDE